MAERYEDESQNYIKKRRPKAFKSDYSQSYKKPFYFKGVKYEFDNDPILFIAKRREERLYYMVNSRKKIHLENNSQNQNRSNREESQTLKEARQKQQVQEEESQRIQKSLNKNDSLLEDKREHLQSKFEHKSKKKEKEKSTKTITGYGSPNSNIFDQGKPLDGYNQGQLQPGKEKYQHGQENGFSLGGVVNKIKELEPVIDEYQQIGGTEIKSHEKMKKVDISVSEEVEIRNQQKNKYCYYQSFRFKGVRYVYEENPQEYLNKRKIYKRLKKRKLDQRKFQKRDMVQYALKDISWERSTKNLKDLAEEEAIKIQIKKQQLKLDVLQPRHKQLFKDCRTLVEQNKSLMRYIKTMEQNVEQHKEQLQPGKLKYSNQQEIIKLRRNNMPFIYEGVRYDLEEDPVRFRMFQTKKHRQQRNNKRKKEQEEKLLAEKRFLKSEQEPSKQQDVISQLKDLHQKRQEEINQLTLYIENLEEEERRLQKKRQKLLLEQQEGPNRGICAQLPIAQFNLYDYQDVNEINEREEKISEVGLQLDGDCRHDSSLISDEQLLQLQEAKEENQDQRYNDQKNEMEKKLLGRREEACS